MNASPRRTRRHTTVFALITASALALTACGGGSDDAGPGGEGKGAVPTEDVVSGVKKDAAAARLLPAEVRERGSLRLATNVGGSPPGNSYLEDGKTITGLDADIATATAKVLGLRLRTEAAGFEAILPALSSGKYDVGTGNFGVTEARRKTIDFVTYINDGQGFAVREDSDLKKVTDLKQLCGLDIGTSAGTTFEATLEENKHICAESGKKPYAVKTYAEQGALWPSLQQGRTDVLMSTINGLRYGVAQQEGLKFLGEFHRLDVGFAFKKGTPLAPAFQAAVNRLIEDGTYARILKKWGTEKSALPASKISPPEIKD
ncbi:ABC transporter substrate-binding protein [Streptomyces albus]|uniref:ABC transporter substrate-binding protein n=1 Tax=Streptomyces albus (strain ATCC 21838 / DSM 41398 / FERM P-419 / JCM 4703 / NBRC 107858) TaxID=1081613 RepID=A0A0B5F7R3_STRA4|nr:ABC transporter substrate-binding protein [Streptomyces albus]AOU80816.1 ABC transporter substrate-binding protein [Streptomyces albus]AYN36521.1 ABC transporter substrate-binding protein [Streptomyces albus]